MGRLVQQPPAAQACGDVPPAEFEQLHYRQIAALETLEAAEPSVH
jgi:hypothetical protein